jgi:hypothetical protein
VRVLSASAPAGWSVTSDANSATWSGGRITGIRVEGFPVELSGSASPEEHARRAVVAGGAGVLIIVLSLVALHRLRRRSLQDS